MKDLTPIDEHDALLRQRDARAAIGLDDSARNETASIATEERMARKRERYERCLPVANDILEEARAALAVRFRFLDRALWRMPLVPSFDIYGICSDGVRLYYDPEFVVDRFKLSPNEVVRDVIHCLFHCIFRHPFMLYSVMREPWDVACDIAVESMLIELVGETFPGNYDGRCQRALRIIRAQVGGVVTAERLYHFFSNEGNRANLRSLAPMFRHDSHGLWYGDGLSQSGSGAVAAVRQQAEEHEGGELPTTEGMSPEQLRDMAGASAADMREAASSSEDVEDASPSAGGDRGKEGSARDGAATDGEGGESEGQGSPDSTESDGGASGGDGDAAVGGGKDSLDVSAPTEEELRSAWEELSRQMQVEIEATVAQRGEAAGNLVAQLRAANRERYNYEEFLRRFSVLCERMMVNDDEFDYIYYTYGMERYGNMPLIEPLEYKDSRGVYDFAVALDTSESCSGDLIKAFVRKTYNILSQSGSFHSRVNIHIIQCDARVQSDKKIESIDDLDLYLENMELRGFGGTDFRPVFEYVNLLCEKGEFSDLRGLVYFTDGLGVFPRKQPDYDAVFVFVDDGFSDPQVPPWALKLLLDEREVMVPDARKAGGRLGKVRI